MKKRLYSGSLLGLNRSTLHMMKANPFIRLFFDEPLDEKRLEEALTKALSDCPYMKLCVKEDEGIFLAAEETDAPFTILKEEPEELNVPENNGHSAAVCCKGNMLGVYVSHALTDGAGIFLFVRSLLDRYFGEEDGVYRGAGKPDYDKDPLETEHPVSDGFQGMQLPDGPFFTIASKKDLAFKDMFVFKTGVAEFRALCKEWNGSVQNTLTVLGMKALSLAYPDNRDYVVARLPVNARKQFGLMNTFQNASLANMRVCASAKELLEDEETDLMQKFSEQIAAQKSFDEIALQYNRWRGVLFAKDREERMQRIVPLLGKDAFLVSSLGRGLVGENYAEHITGVSAGAMMFPLMIYGMEIGDRMFFSAYDAAGNDDYKNALKKVLERRGIDIEELDPATGKTI